MWSLDEDSHGPEAEEAKSNKELKSEVARLKTEAKIEAHEDEIAQLKSFTRSVPEAVAFKKATTKPIKDDGGASLELENMGMGSKEEESNKAKLPRRESTIAPSFGRRRSSNSSFNTRLENDVQTQKQRSACVQFIIMLVFIIGFLTMAWIHEDIETVYELEHAMDIELSKPFGQHSHTFRDVRDVVEIWEWLEKGLMPTLVHHKDAVGHTLPHEQWGYLAEYNRVIGGLRIIQERGKSHPCPYHKLDEFYSECQPFDTVDRAPFGYPDCNNAGAMSEFYASVDDYDSSHGITTCYDSQDYAHTVDLRNDEGFTVDSETEKFEMWIDLLDEEAVINKRVKYLGDRHWIDKNTKKISFILLAYNGNLQPLLCEAKLTFEFSRVGYVTPVYEIHTIPLDAYHSNKWFKVILEVLFIGGLLYLFVTEVREIRGRRARRKAVALWTGKQVDMTWAQATWEHYTGEDALGNYVDVCFMAVGFTLCLFWGVVVGEIEVLANTLSELHRPDSVVTYDDTDHDEWSEYHHEIGHIEELAEHAMDVMKIIREMAVLMTFLMIFQLFKIWDDIPAMQGVSATIRAAGPGLFSFGIILISLLSIFAGSAMLAFGHRMEEFHNFYIAVKTTLIVMTTAATEVYDEQNEVDPIVASCWHWLLITVMYVVCLNLVLCILVDAYAACRSERDDEDHQLYPTLYEQGADTLKFYSRWFIESLSSENVSGMGADESCQQEKKGSAKVSPETATSAAASKFLQRKQIEETKTNQDLNLSDVETK